MMQIANEICGQALSPDRGGYTITMREDPGTDSVLQQLAADDPAPGRMHMGWGSFRNLDIIAARSSACALIFDLNQHQLVIWHTLAETIVDCGTAEELISRLTIGLPDKPRLRRFTDTVEAWLRSDLGRAESWLCSNNTRHFKYIRGLFRKRAIGIACLDICECEPHRDQPLRTGFTRLAGTCRQLQSSRGIFPDTLYISNIPYMLRNNSGFFGKPEWRWVSDAHSRNDPTTGDTALRKMWDNLRGVVGPGALTVQAAQLAEGFTDEDPQWQTSINTFEQASTQGYQ